MCIPHKKINDNPKTRGLWNPPPPLSFPLNPFQASGNACFLNCLSVRSIAYTWRNKAPSITCTCRLEPPLSGSCFEFLARRVFRIWQNCRRHILFIILRWPLRPKCLIESHLQLLLHASIDWTSLVICEKNHKNLIGGGDTILHLPKYL